MSVQCLRCWSSIKPSLAERLAFTVNLIDLYHNLDLITYHTAMRRCHDWLAVYGANDTTSSRRLAMVCGHDTPVPFVNKGLTRIRFKTDSSVTDAGWLIHYTVTREYGRLTHNNTSDNSRQQYYRRGLVDTLYSNT